MAATLVSFRTQGFGVEGALVISLACLLGDDIKKQWLGPCAISSGCILPAIITKFF